MVLQHNQSEGAYNLDGRGLANVDVVPIGEDRATITGQKRCFLEGELFYPAKEAIDMYHHYKEDIALLQKWVLRPIGFPLFGPEFFLRGDEAEPK